MDKIEEKTSPHARSVLLQKPAPRVGDHQAGGSLDCVDHPAYRSVSARAKITGPVRPAYLRYGIIFLAALLGSSLLVLYSKDLSRRLFVRYGLLRQQSAILQANWGRLLLENATLSTSARVQRIASSQLGMILPPAKSVVMVVLPPVTDAANNNPNPTPLGR